MNINVDILRGRSALSNSNNSRESFIYSNVFSIPYHIRMEIQSNNSLQSKQVKEEKIALSYAINAKKNDLQVKQGIDNSPKKGIQYAINNALVLNNIPSS